MQNIFAIHEPGGEHLIREAGRTGWIVFTEAIGHDPNDHSGKDFTPWAHDGIQAVCRINNAYGSGGTIPLPGDYEAFAHRCANYVAASHGCEWWIIGNEIAMPWDHPDGKAISLRDYVRCYKLCVDAIKSLTPDAKCMMQPPAPWNNLIQYAGNERGDWVKQMSDQLEWAGPANVDGIAIHTYTHGQDPALIDDDARMGDPFGDRHFHFRAYRDFLDNVPAGFRHLPVFITETDQDEVWADANNGWVQRAYAEIDAWNKRGGQQIHCLALYRWPDFDKWVIATKSGVHDDLRAALQHDYHPVQQISPYDRVKADVVPQTAYRVGDTARMADITNYRRTPGYSGKPDGDIIKQLQQGVKVVLTNGPVSADGLTWWQVREGDNLGWVAEVSPGGVELLKPFTGEDYITRLSAAYGVDERIIRAVIGVESGGSGFRNGRLLARFEPHIFKGKIGAGRWFGEAVDHIFRMGDPAWNGDQHSYSPDGGNTWVSFHGNQDLEWRAIERAVTIDQAAAYESASYGAPQIMGFNYPNVGYSSAKEMVDAFSQGEDVQIEAMFKFMAARGAIEKLRQGDFVGFASIYNGAGQAQIYANLIKGALDG